VSQMCKNLLVAFSVFIFMYWYRGRIEGVIKELLNRRAKLKMVEGLVAQHLRNQVSEKERMVREEYEKAFIK